MDITNDKSSRFLIPNFEKKDSKSNSKKEKQLKYAKILDGDLERLGFFAVFNNPDKPKESFVELMESHKKSRKSLKFDEIAASWDRAKVSLRFTACLVTVGK